MPYFTTSDGTRLHYRVEGSGSPTLLFVHGWCSNLRHWDPQATFLSSRHRVIRHDRRGHGRSDASKDGYAPEQHAEDLAELARSLRVRNAVVIGHAGGGPTVLEFAHRYPELARRVVLIEAGLYAPAMFQSAASGLSGALRGADGQGAFDGIYRGFFHAAADRRMTEHAVREAIATPIDVALQEFEGLAVDTQALAKSLTQPVLWIAAVPAEGMSDSQTIAAAFRDSTYGQVVGAAHFPQLEVPAQVNDMISRFLRVAARG